MARSDGKTCGSAGGRKRAGGHAGSLNRREITRLAMGEILARPGAGQSAPVGRSAAALRGIDYRQFAVSESSCFWRGRHVTRVRKTTGSFDKIHSAGA